MAMDTPEQPTVVESHQPQASEAGGASRKKSSLNKFSLVCALLASTCSILLGYDIGVMSGAVLYIKDEIHISSVQVEILVGSLNVCSLIGSLASGKTSDLIGRRYTIVLAAATFLIGALLMSLAPSYLFLMAGRVVAGIGVGYSLMIAPVYTAELSPAMTRGFLTSLPEVFITFGILLGYIANYALAGLPPKINWRMMLGIAAVPAIVIGISVIGMPESPRWLVMKGRISQAKQILIRTSDDEEEAELRLSEIMREASTTTSAEWSGQGVWMELLCRPSKPIRRILVAAIGMNFFMQASGNDAVVYYSPAVFENAGINDRRQLVGVTIIMGITKTAFVLVSALFLDRYGRRPLLLLGSIGMAVSLGGLALGSKYLEDSEHKPTWAIALCVVAVCADVSFFSIGLGPITWVYSSEIFPTRLRAQGTSMAVSVNRLVSGVVAMTFLSISKAITFGGMFLVFCGVMVIGSIFFYFFIPETKGKSLEDIATLFEDKPLLTDSTRD
ncbi:hypothetical protein VitviT2T_016531 [Vitis vinifera]|uniref:Polyol transporter 5 n=2 Tax=Vitis vinifera TaxID=29760 RepID=E3VWW1_VITVI|nr:putative polyol/monosaccharide transporter [Vitis vinifera]RVW96380.1 Polyol transporter 5 [Vitis vinifera]WJZ97968.1 hypothetical protein VitviT2T_016531 [Vitis vinifera]|eukprot:XP_002280978.1 PREDICTED: polyol transporter 5 [Vitis vinifera]